MNVELVVEMWTQAGECKVRASKVIPVENSDDELFAMRTALEMITRCDYNLRIYITHTDKAEGE